ncbi:gliding motility lipoprotein GldH [uncultured Alloprevotella sp.]|uniref:gliding motility lipoprotein GldH n=1 Tax=uncultured Alloprevotella sp. TaxID=1283315 RepID=UPI00325FC429
MLRKPKMHSAGLAPLFVLLLLIVVGCGQRRVETYCFRATPVDGWETTDSLVFPIDTIHQAGRYRLSIGVRTSAANPYPFQTLALSITTRLQGKKAQRDTALCSLTDKDGDVNGQGVSLYQYAFPVSELHLEKGQTGTVTVQHLMRRNLLPGVANVGICLERIP